MAKARELGDEVVAMCREMGFALAGIAPAQPSAFQDQFRSWLADGKHASMEWLARNSDDRLDPRRVLAGVRSIIIAADVYALGSAAEEPRSANIGRIARYARGDDYHDVIKQRLHSLCDALRERFPADEFRAFVDTAPVMEREHAVRAGLGWAGKHTLLIHPQLGSWMLLGGVLTTLDLEPPTDHRVIEDHCGTCTRCIDACPTKAITPYSVDARRCISYLTIEHRGPIEREFHEPIGDWLYGCDICQEVCPHNRERSTNPDSEGGACASEGQSSTNPYREGGAPVHPAYTPRRNSFDLLEVLGWTEEDRRTALARSAMKRAKLDMWKRNALIVAGNVLAARVPSRTACPSGQAVAPHSSEVRQRVEQIEQDDHESELVRETARAVLKGLKRE